MVENSGQQPHTPKIVRQLWWLGLAAALAVLLASLPGYAVIAIASVSAAEFSTPARVTAWLEIGFALSAAGLSLGLATLLFWKKRNESMGLFLSFYLLLYAAILSGPIERAVEYWLPQFPYLALQLQGIFFVLPGVVLFLIFPNGHFAPRWSRVLVFVTAILMLPMLALEPEEMVKLNTVRAQLFNFPSYFLLVLALVIQGYRYQRIYTRLERQQTKWVIYGSLVYLTLLIAVGIPYYYKINLPPGIPSPEWTLLLNPLWYLAVNILPISFTLAILRSRLWDIDVIIRRTLLYALVTLTLALIYLASVIVLQRVFSVLTGVVQNEIVTVLSTLAIAALFVPLRNRIQFLIDRRFNRNKYDAQQVLNDYATTVRDETDLEKLTGRLIEVVNETMQPQSVSVWLPRDPVTVNRAVREDTPAPPIQPMRNQQ